MRPDFPTVALGNSGDLALGQRVVAIGYALALDGGPTVTTGIVSSLDRTIQAQDLGCETCPTKGDPPVPVRTYSDVIQTDAAINHGNSGGPLVDMQGRVVGINSAGDDQAENIGFAIAIDSAKDTIAKARAVAAGAHGLPRRVHPTRHGGPRRSARAERRPGRVRQRHHQRRAGRRAPGIGEGDVIVAVDGRTVNSPDDLGSILDSIRPDTTVPVEIVGPSGEQRTIQVTLAERPLARSTSRKADRGTACASLHR